MIDARPQTGTAPDEQTEMRYPTRASELDHRRLQVPPSLLHDSSTNQLHAGAWRTSQSCVRCLTKDIRETGPAGRPGWLPGRAISRLTISAARDRLLSHTNARTRTGTTSRHRSVSRSLPRHKRPPIARQEQQLRLPPKPAQRYPSPARISPPVMANASSLQRADGAEMSAPSS